MDKWLALSINEQKEVIDVSAAHLALPNYAVEKDLWVTECLRQTFDLSFAKHLVFKGGTSLSKAWKVIDRFSEDIDLTIDYRYLGFTDEINGTQLRKLRRQAQAFVKDQFFPELKEKLQTFPLRLSLEQSSDSVKDSYKIFITYDPLTPHTPYVLPKITLEIGGRSLHEPNTLRPIASMIHEVLPDLPYLDGEFSVSVANVEKTFLDKLFLLHEIFQCSPRQMSIERMSRHLYDVNRIGQTEYAESAINDHQLYHDIVSHRRVFTHIRDVDYDLHFPPNLNPTPPEHLFRQWSEDYKKTKEQMIVGEAPSFEKLIQSIQIIADQINGK